MSWDIGKYDEGIFRDYCEECRSGERKVIVINEEVHTQVFHSPQGDLCHPCNSNTIECITNMMTVKDCPGFNIGVLPICLSPKGCIKRCFLNTGSLAEMAGMPQMHTELSRVSSKSNSMST